MAEKIVIALGGNALQSGKGEATAEAQLKVVKKTTSLTDQHIHTSCRMVIVGVSLKMVCKFSDTSAKYCDLYFR